MNATTRYSGPTSGQPIGIPGPGTWVQVTSEMLGRLVIGKTYLFDGRKGKVLNKAEGIGTLANGIASGSPMVKVQWR